jgi:UDP-N-acetylglucosamine/UDP-N-acetylgalactosamine diphosphorylase
MLPAVDLEGKIMMNSSFEIKLAPNGNGGFFDSIVKIDRVRAHIETLDYVQVIGVDNIMNKILDPVQIGFTHHNDYTVSLKTCPKAYPGEKVGVAAKKDGQYAIVEYSELTEEHANARL